MVSVLNAGVREHGMKVLRQEPESMIIMMVLRLRKEGFYLVFGFCMVTVLKTEVREYDMRVLRQKSESMI